MSILSISILFVRNFNSIQTISKNNSFHRPVLDCQTHNYSLKCGFPNVVEEIQKNKEKFQTVISGVLAETETETNKHIHIFFSAIYMYDM